MALNNETPEENIWTTSLLVFDREEGSMNPGITGLPEAIVRGIADDQAAIRNAAGIRPTSRRSMAGPRIQK